MANVGFSLTGAAASSYSIAATTCGALLASGSSCTAQIVFTPGATGAIAATLAVSSSTSGVAPVSVPLNGSGMLSSGLTTNPAQIAFPVVAAGQSSTAQPVTVTNSSSYAISAVSLAAAAPFSVTQNTCTGGLAAGANCTASVVFQPSAAGSATGALTVTSSAVATPATVPLSGTGFDFAVSITGSTSQTVAAGQQASFTMIVAPIGSGGAFAFSCGTLPTNALCLFNPSTQTLNAGVQGTVLVEISTGNGATVRLEKPDFARPNLGEPDVAAPDAAGPSSGRPAFPRPLPLACALLLVPLAFFKRRKLFLLVVMAATFVGGVSSCTSSGGGTGGTGGSGGGSNTPPGTYTIPVTVTSLGITHSLKVTVTVD
jgi:hypothetical protein